MSASLRSARFRAEREAGWRDLERLVKKAELRSVRALSDDELIQLPALYRSTLSALSIARATSLDAALVAYLESLSARAYFFVYGPRGRLGERLVRYLAIDLPAAMKGLWRETLICFALTVVGAVVAYVLVASDPDWYFAFVPRGLTQGRDPSATVETLRSMLYDGKSKQDELTTFAAYLFTHNASVALFAFALGFAFCLPTVFLILTNGLTLGAMVEIYVAKGLGVQLGGWLAIHGVTEMFAVILAGAAGLRMGWAVAFPGRRSRAEAAMQAGQDGARVMGGVVLMLMAAGLLEGVGRQMVVNDMARYAIAAATAVFWGVYYYWPRRAGAIDGA